MLGLSGQAKAQTLLTSPAYFTFVVGNAISGVALPSMDSHEGAAFVVTSYSGIRSEYTPLEDVGVTFNYNTGMFSGNPTREAAHTFSLQSYDGDTARNFVSVGVETLKLRTTPVDFTFTVGTSIVNATLASRDQHGGAVFAITSYSGIFSEYAPLEDAGVTFSYNTGVFSGNPTQVLANTFSLQSYDGDTARNFVTVRVLTESNAVIIAQQADIDLTAGFARTVALNSAVGGTTPYTYALTRMGGTLPPTSILSLDSTNAMLTAGASIASSHAGNYILTVRDAGGETASTNFAISVADRLRFESTANPGDTTFLIGDVESITLGNATDGQATVNYTLTAAGTAVNNAANVVAGVAYTAASGGTAATISGTPTAAADVAIVYAATDANGASVTFQFNLVVLPKPTFATQQTDLEFTAGFARTFNLAQATSGSGTLTYTLARQTGNLRTQALVFASSRALRSTAALETGDAGDYILTATDTNNIKAHTTFSINVADELAFPGGANPGNRAVLTTSASSITLGNASGGKATVVYVFSVDGTTVTNGNAVVAGMNYTAISGSTAATISGTPTALNTGVDVTYIATDANSAAVTFGFTLSVVDKPTFPANITATYTRTYPLYSSGGATSRSGEVLTLPAASGGTGTIAYTDTNNLPGGLSAGDLSDGRQVIRGSPTQSGMFVYTRYATATSGAGTFTLTLHIVAEPSFATSQSTAYFTAGNADTVNLTTASDGVGDLTYSLSRISGTVPAALTIDTATAVLGATGAIAAADTGRYIVTATDKHGATATLTFQVQVDDALGITVGDLNLTIGTAVQLPAASQGRAPFIYSVSGLGSGLTFNPNPSSRTIDGALTIAAPADLTLSLTYGIEDANGATTSDAFMLHIIPLRFATAQRTLRFIPEQAQTENLGDALTSAAGAGTVAYAIDPDPSALDGLSYDDNNGNPQLIATADFAVADDAVLDYTLTATYIIGTGNTAVTHTATQNITLDVRQGGEQLAPVNEEVISKVAASVVGSTLSAITERIAAANIATPLALIGGQTPQTALANYAKAVADGAEDNNALLANSRFVLPFASLPSSANIGAIWGSVQMRELDGDVDAVDWSGDVSGLHLGVDFKVDENLIGVAVSKSDADIDYKTTDAQGKVTEGKYEVELTALHPYINRQFGDIDAWASIGLGSGEMTVTEKGGDAIKSDLALTALGGGVGMQIVQGLQLRVEVQTADIDIEGNTASGLLQQDLSTNSIRALARWQNLYLTPTVPLFTANQTAFFEAGMRRDSGDGESRRAAMEAALGWNYRGQRATIEAAAHGLFGRKEYREWGAYTNVRVSGGDDGQGLSLRIRPSYGEAQGEFGRVWNADSFDDIVADDSNSDNTAYQWRTETRLSYGIQSASGLVAPFVDAAADTYRLGVDWSPHRYFDVNLTGERRHGNDDADERRVLLQGEVKF